MRFKIDENLPKEVADILNEHGFLAETVGQENLSGVSDAALHQHSCKEKRILVTLDLDFANIISLPPLGTPGRIVLRLLSQDKYSVCTVIRKLVNILRSEPLSDHIWIVEDNQVRIWPSSN